MLSSVSVCKVLLSVLLFAGRVFVLSDIQVSVAPLVGWSIDINKVNPLEDVLTETTGHLKPLLNVEHVDKCLLDMRRETGQSTTAQISLVSDIYEFVDKIEGAVDVDVGLKAFTLKLQASLNIEKTKNTEKTYIFRKTTITKGTVTLDPDCLADPNKMSPSFKQALKALGGGKRLPQYYFESERHLWLPFFEFFNGWGSHVVTGATYGFKFDTTIIVDTESQADIFELAAKLEMEGESAGMKGEVDLQKIKRHSRKNVNVMISILGGGMQESVDLTNAADAIFGDLDRAEKMSKGASKEAMKSGEGIDGYNRAVGAWQKSCAYDADTSRPVRATYTSWAELIKANYIATLPHMRADLERATRVYLLLNWRSSCPLGSWNERSLHCDSNHHDEKVLDKESFIKAANGKYAFYNPKTKVMQLVESTAGATRFTFKRSGSPFDAGTLYGMKMKTEIGMQSLFWTGTGFEMANIDKDVKGMFQFLVTSMGAIALAPTRNARAGYEYRPLQQFVQQDGNQLIVCEPRDKEPDHENGLLDDQGFFFMFEDPNAILETDGRGMTVYQGGTAGGMWNGQGLLQWGPEPSTYEGHWKDDKFHGRGMLKVLSEATPIRYNGHFKEGAPFGRGTMMKSLIPVIGSKPFRWLEKVWEGRWDGWTLKTGYLITRDSKTKEVLEIYSGPFNGKYEKHGQGEFIVMEKGKPIAKPCKHVAGKRLYT